VHADPSFEGRRAYELAGSPEANHSFSRATKRPEERTLRAGMRLRIDSTDQLDELMAFLDSKADTVVLPIAPDELEVSLLGSRNNDAMRMELYLRLRAWEAGRKGSGPHVEIVD
jgi:hypothetical protein